ncbi:MAG TPA: DUF4476 domain-containing protein [Myxococcus sp.]|nr:DUF4476 domain-containing protein [Myxococcus sp.]
MKALTLAVVALLSASSAFAQGAEKQRPPVGGQTMPQPQHAPQHAPQPPSRPGNQVVLDRNELNERLARMERLLEEVADRMDRSEGRGYGKLRRAQETLDSLQDMVAEAPPLGGVVPPRPQPQPLPPPPPPQPVVRPMQEGAFKRMNEAIARESFAEDKMRVLTMAARDNHFLVSQVSQLLTYFPFSQDKLTVVRELKPRILDLENGYQLQSAFSFSGDKKKLQEILAQR